MRMNRKRKLEEGKWVLRANYSSDEGFGEVDVDGTPVIRQSVRPSQQSMHIGSSHCCQGLFWRHRSAFSPRTRKVLLSKLSTCSSHRLLITSPLLGWEGHLG